MNVQRFQVNDEITVAYTGNKSLDGLEDYLFRYSVNIEQLSLCFDPHKAVEIALEGYIEKNGQCDLEDFGIIFNYTIASMYNSVVIEYTGQKYTGGMRDFFDGQSEHFDGLCDCYHDLNTAGITIVEEFIKETGRFDEEDLKDFHVRF